MKTIEEMKSFPAARKNYRPEKVEKLSEEQMKWFRDAKFGMFIHWGVFSMLGKGEWFDSKCSDFTAMKGAAHRDFVKEYVEACRKE